MPVLVSVTATSSGGVPVWGVMVNPALGAFGVAVAVGVAVTVGVTAGAFDGVAVGVTVGVAVGVTVGVTVGADVEPTVTCFVVEEEPRLLVTVWVTVYTPALGYVCAGLFAVALGVLSPK